MYVCIYTHTQTHIHKQSLYVYINTCIRIMIDFIFEGSKLHQFWPRHSSCRIYVYMHVYMYVCTYSCTMYACMYVRMYAYMNVLVHVCMYVCDTTSSTWLHYVRMYVCIYIYMYIYSCILGMHACTNTEEQEITHNGLVIRIRHTYRVYGHIHTYTYVHTL